MKLGVSISSTHPANGPRLMIERARTAYGAGFRSLTIGDHHNMSVPYAQNTPMLGRLMAEWPDRPAGCLFLMPLWHPVLMAEQIGTLAATLQARFIVQTGIGSGQDQFRAFGADLTTRAKMLEESIRVVKALLAGEVVNSDLLQLEGGRVGLMAPQPVEWWVSGGVERAIRRAATIGDAWYAAPSVNPDEAVAMIDAYREAGGTRPIVRKDALVLSDGDQARRLAQELVSAGYRGMELSSLLVGSPDDVAEQLAEYAAVGFEEVIIRCMSIPQELALETLELTGPLSDQARGA